MTSPCCRVKSRHGYEDRINRQTINALFWEGVAEGGKDNWSKTAFKEFSGGLVLVLYERLRLYGKPSLCIIAEPLH
jgi:hypothetical protein